MLTNRTLLVRVGAIALLIGAVAWVKRDALSSAPPTMMSATTASSSSPHSFKSILSHGSQVATSSTSSNTAALKVNSKYLRLTGRKIAAEYSEALGTIVQIYDQETAFSLISGEAAYWYIDGNLETETACEELSYTFTKVSHHTLKAVTESGDEYEFDINAKVVRWEFRDLDEDDRVKYLVAVQKMYFMTQAEGVSIYGSDYQGASALIRMHILGAAGTECDHWHDDMGMPNHHVGITWLFEKSLRMIEPSTASHYWDFTRSVDSVWEDSNMFRDDWFGTNSPSNSDHVLDTGRFAYTPVMQNARQFSPITNPYGFLRSPWNTNKVPYLSRYNKTSGVYADGEKNFPFCTSFANMVDATMGKTVNELNGALHGPVHIMIGGHYGMGEKWENLVEGIVSAESSELLLGAKFLWRQGVIRSPKYCSLDSDSKDCTMYCPDEIVGDFTSKEILLKFGLYHLAGVWDSVVDEAFDQGFTDEEVKGFICGIFHPGEMFTSAAPQDPLFWPLHGDVERFILLKYRLMEEGHISFDTTWKYEHSSNLPSDTHVVCDWSEVEGLEMPTCTKTTCSGHKEFDLLPFTGLHDDQGDVLYTNADFLHMIQPSVDKTPYVYDSLDYWPGCTYTSMYETYEDQIAA